MPNPAQWRMSVQSFSFKNKTKNILYTKNGCKVLIEPGSFNVKENDTVKILITEYNDPVDFIAGGLPMSYYSRGKTKMYQSEQMMKIEAFIDSMPVQLVKLMGLECPNVDTSMGVRLYEFNAQAEKNSNVLPKITKGRVEEVAVSVELPEKKAKLKELNPIIDNVTKKSEEPEIKTTENVGVKNERKDIPKNRNTKGQKTKNIKGQNSSEVFVVSKKKKKKKIFELASDTGRGFKIEPDTGKGIKIKPDTSRIFPYSYWYGNTTGEDRCPEMPFCSEINLCDSAEILKLINFGLKYKNKKFNINYNFDFKSFSQRYRNLAYDGVNLKCLKRTEELYTVKIKVKKRFLHKDLILEFTSTINNTEYAPLESTRWIIHYGSHKKMFQFFNELKISDFRIIPLRREAYGKNSKEIFYVELKTDSVFYRCPAQPKRPNKTYKRYWNYEKAYTRKEENFNSELSMYIDDNRIRPLYCLYNLTQILSNNRTESYRCRHGFYNLPPCYSFSFFKGSKKDNPNQCEELDACLQNYKGLKCGGECFSLWIKYYDEHMEEFKAELEELKNNPSLITDCYDCKVDSLESDEPCAKWEHVDPNAIGNTITYIGLGIYNFDSEMALERKQYVEDAVYLNKDADTLFKCRKVLYRGRPKKECDHITYSIIPGFNGLLKQNHTETLILLPGKENMLFFQKYNRSYKLYLDLRNVTEYKSRVFILKEITDKATNMDDLKLELEKKE